MLVRLFATVACFALSARAFAADWKPADAPLMTKWGKKVTPDNAWREYPRPQMERKQWQNLNGLWNYAIVKKGEVAGKPDGQILVPYPIESALSGVGKRVSHEQELIYTRTFTVPKEWKGKRVLLHFGAVDWEATVRVNGKDFPTHRGGNDPFNVDITDALKDGDNELVVRVWDPTDTGAQPRGKQIRNPHGIWYTPVTGIWQTVWLEPVSESRIDSVAFTPDIERDEVEILVRSTGAAREVSVAVSEPGAKLPVLATGETGKPFRCKIGGAKLWTPDSPTLYAARVQLRGAKLEDEAASYFAMRTVKAAKDDKGVMRLLLNGKPVFQYGPLDQGWWPDGLLTPPSEEAMRYDLEVLKKLGFNMLRKHIKVEPARYYYDCDRMGLLVWQDMPSGGVPSRGHLIPPGAKEDAKFTDDEKKQFRTELKAMIDHLRFFPCIVMWVPFNEGWGQHDTNAILKWVKEYDPSRPVSGPSGWEDRGYGDTKDAHIYPGPGMFPVMPDRVSVLGEFGGLGLPVKDHLWKNTDNWGYRTYKTTDELRANYKLLVRRLHPLIGQGLSAAVYTQTTDVEVEVNGLMTYDREVIKFDVPETLAWHKALAGPPPERRDILATSEKVGQKWKWTLDPPPKEWRLPEYNVKPWDESVGGFGTEGTPGAVIGTKWDKPAIHIRRTFELKELPSDVIVRMHHDEDAEVWINGVRVLRATGFTVRYEEFPLSAEALKAFKKGTNVLAITCRQTSGGQYIDAGLAEFVEKK